MISQGPVRRRAVYSLWWPRRTAVSPAAIVFVYRRGVVRFGIRVVKIGNSKKREGIRAFVSIR